MKATSRHALKVGGITPFTATDYPGKLAAVIFVQGCPWRCTYCHNPHLQQRTQASTVKWQEILDFLKRRVGLIDAVVFSGGEPTMDPALSHAMAEVRELGFLVGLHTACIYPQRLQQVLPIIDWIGFDIKTLPDQYDKITGIANSGKSAYACVKMIIDQGVAHECRTTIHPALFTDSDLLNLAQQLVDIGVKNYVLQIVRTQANSNSLLDAYVNKDYPATQTLQKIKALFTNCDVRRVD